MPEKENLQSQTKHPVKWWNSFFQLRETHPDLWWIFPGAVFVVVAILAIWLLPEFLVTWDTRGSTKPLTTSEQVSALNSARQGVLLAVGGVIAVVTLLVTLAKHNLDRKGQALDEKMQALAEASQALDQKSQALAEASQALDEKRQALAQDSNWTNRYSDAIKLLGDSSSFAIRLGGIYALERIAQDSKRDRQTILDVLCAYLREKSPAPTGTGGAATPMETDTAAAAEVVGRITQLSEPKTTVDLRNTNLSGAQLVHAHLQEAHLEGAHLQKANLQGVHLEGSHLEGAHLEEAYLIGAHLQKGSLIDGTHLEGAYLQKAILIGAYLQEANLGGAHLQEAQLLNANLEKAILIGAHLQGARLSTGYLSWADFDGANLSGALRSGMDPNAEDSNQTGIFFRALPKQNLMPVTREYLEDAGARNFDKVVGLPDE